MFAAIEAEQLYCMGENSLLELGAMMENIYKVMISQWHRHPVLLTSVLLPVAGYLLKLLFERLVNRKRIKLDVSTEYYIHSLTGMGGMRNNEYLMSDKSSPPSGKYAKIKIKNQGDKETSVSSIKIFHSPKILAWLPKDLYKYLPKIIVVKEIKDKCSGNGLAFPEKLPFPLSTGIQKECLIPIDIIFNRNEIDKKCVWLSFGVISDNKDRFFKIGKDVMRKHLLNFKIDN